MKILYLIITLLIPVLFSVSVLPAFAETGMSVSVNAAEGSTTISVSGHTSVKNNQVQIITSAPSGNIISVSQVMPDANGDFAIDIAVGGSSWKQDGMYTIGIKQGSSTLYDFSLQVEVTGGTTAATSVSESTLESGTPGIVDIPIGVNGLVITADAVQGSKIIGIIGNTDRTNDSITIIVIAPNGNIISVDQVMPDANGNFKHDIEIDHLWSQNGYYTITAQQGESSSYKDSVDVEIIDGRIIGGSVPIPEPDPSSCGPGTVFDSATNSCVLEEQPESRLPAWVKNIFIWYGQDKISEDELINALQFLIRQGTIRV